MSLGREALPSLSSSKNNGVVRESLAHGFENTGASLSFCSAPCARWISLGSPRAKIKPRFHVLVSDNHGLCDLGAIPRKLAGTRLATALIEAPKIQ